MDETVIIGIAGPSGSGKSLLAEALARQLPDAAILCADSYYRDLSRVKDLDFDRYDLDEPQALEYQLLSRHLSVLKHGGEVTVPLYDYRTHTRAVAGKRFGPHGFIILEGLHVLHRPDVREHLALKVYVDAPDDLCLARRIERDTTERGDTREEVIRRYEGFVRPACIKYVIPSRSFADLIVDGSSPVAEAAAVLARRLRTLS